MFKIISSSSLFLLIIVIGYSFNGFISFFFFLTDLIFAGDSAVVFKVIVSVLKYHKDNLMACIGFETIMDYLKNAVPIVDKRILEAVIKDVGSSYSFK